MIEHSTGEDPRFRELFVRYYRRAYCLFLRRGFSSDDARELTQETFLRIHRGMAAYRGGQWAFVLEVAENVLKNSFRYSQAKGRDLVKESIDDPEALSGPASGNPIGATAPATPEELLLAGERAMLLRAAIERLPNGMRCAILMQMYGDLSYLEIGLAMGKSSGAVKTLLRRTRDKLRQELGPSI